MAQTSGSARLISLGCFALFVTVAEPSRTSVVPGQPTGLALDAAGNLYVADTGNHRICKIDPTGTITTIAGTGEQGFSGDGGPAVAAQLASPKGVALDATDNLYIADTGNLRIRKVDSTGTITTIAGTGERGFSGDGGPAIMAQFACPKGMAVDSGGNLYIADPCNGPIRKIDSTGTVTTTSGTEEWGFRGDGDGGPVAVDRLYYPQDIALDAAGNLYVADAAGSGRLHKIDSTGRISTIAETEERAFGDEAGTGARWWLSLPVGLALDAAGNLYVVDAPRHWILKIDSDGRVSRIAGMGEGGLNGDGGPAIEARLYFPQGLALDAAGNLYVVDAGNDRIRKIDSSGTITTIAGRGESGFIGDGGPAVKARLSGPESVALDAAGNLYVADRGNGRIRKIDSSGTITTVAGTGETQALPVTVTFSPGRSATRGSSGDGGPAVKTRLTPRDLASDAAGNLYVADADDHRIVKIEPTGTVTAIAGTGESGFSGDGGPAIMAQLAVPEGVALDASGNLYVADSFNSRIRKIDSRGTIRTIAGTGESAFGGDGGPAVEAWLSPVGVALDAAGSLYFADALNNRVRKIDSTGRIRTIAGTGEDGFSGDGGPATKARFDSPEDVALDAAGNLYVADGDNGRIRKIDSTGTVSTIAGTGDSGFGGDGGPAIMAQFTCPTGVAVDAVGNLYVADACNDRIRKIDSSGRIHTIAGTGDSGFSFVHFSD